MLINWFTVFAQVINFLILVFLLKRFLYGPIIRAMEAREKKISGQLEQAEKARKEATALEESLKKEMQDLVASREEMQAQAREEIIRWRETSLELAQKEVERAKAAWLESLDGEKERFRQELKENVARHVLKVSQKVLEDLAEDRLDHQVIRAFLKKCAREKTNEGIRELADQQNCTVFSGFALSMEMKELIQSELNSLFPGLKVIQFETLPELGLGLRIATGDFQVEWNLSWYLKNLGKDILGSLLPERRVA
ncbi:F0F1 ATP synthase subunit B [Thermodesulfobacteriota bacterium]